MEDGVWRTIGGRRVFIKEGQSLSDAMKESGKFNNETNKITLTKTKEEKLKQLEIINETNPAPNDYLVWIRTEEDVLSGKEAYNEANKIYKEYGSITYPDTDISIWEDAMETGEITIYSSYDIKNGNFVSISEMEAQEYAGSNKVFSETVYVNDVAWINDHEGQFAKINT